MGIAILGPKAIHATVHEGEDRMWLQSTVSAVLTINIVNIRLEQKMMLCQLSVLLMQEVAIY